MRKYPKMTRAHFELIAEVLREIHPFMVEGLHCDLVENFVSKLYRTNHAFKGDKFRMACRESKRALP